MPRGFWDTPPTDKSKRQSNLAQKSGLDGGGGAGFPQGCTPPPAPVTRGFGADYCPATEISRTGPSSPDGSRGESALYGAKSVNVYFFTA